MDKITKNVITMILEKNNDTTRNEKYISMNLISNCLDLIAAIHQDTEFDLNMWAYDECDHELVELIDKNLEEKLYLIINNAIKLLKARYNASNVINGLNNKCNIIMINQN